MKALKSNRFQAFVNHRVPLVYQVVSDVNRYSEFVPWCKESKIIQTLSSNQVLADLTVGFYGVTEETFRSLVTFEENKSVEAVSTSNGKKQPTFGSPLKGLRSLWTFEENGLDQTKVEMNLEFEFYNPLYTNLSSYFLDRVSNLAMKAFINRCQEIKTINTTTTTTTPSIISPNFVLSTEAITSFASSTHFVEEEVEAMYYEFNKFQENGRLKKNGLALWLQDFDVQVMDALFKAMDKDQNGSLSVREFISGISLIARGNAIEKRFTFFGNRKDEEITKEELQNVILCVLLVQRAFLRTWSQSSITQIKSLPRPEQEANRLVAPVFRGQSVNGRALERLFATV